MTTASKILQKLFLPFNASRLYLPVATDHEGNRLVVEPLNGEWYEKGWEPQSMGLH